MSADGDYHEKAVALRMSFTMRLKYFSNIFSLPTSSVYERIGVWTLCDFVEMPASYIARCVETELLVSNLHVCNIVCNKRYS